jgi:hypothetical protein
LFNFLLFPNPTHKELIIQREEESLHNGIISIFSSNGLAVYKGIMDDESLMIQTDEWAQGVYFVQILVNGKIAVKRLVIL